ncbi:MAG TPA: hypothetical protein VG347_24815 [Verrucomicrobiae bacterium]|nr:hypothetical protein [Verrucomicrobiae bacterium]
MQTAQDQKPVKLLTRQDHQIIAGLRTEIIALQTDPIGNQEAIATKVQAIRHIQSAPDDSEGKPLSQSDNDIIASLRADIIALSADPFANEAAISFNLAAIRRIQGS